MDTELNKPRSDAWDAELTEAQRWQAYAKFRRSSWFEVSAWAAAQFGVDAPSRSALYRWSARMREQESAHRIEQSIVAREEIGTLASTVASDSALIDAYKTLAADLALKGNAADAVKFTVMAMELGNGQRKAAELELKARAQETKDAVLKLAREKFEAAEARLVATRTTLERLNQSGGLTAEARAEIEKAMNLL
jgi:hypothetical protein